MSDLETQKNLQNLQSGKSNRRLEQIASLRARGIGDRVELPQLVVCGDQSTGKSSILEGITGIPFPRQDGVCTKFATEIIMEHSLEPLEITATILPCKGRSEHEQKKLNAYKRCLGDFSDLASVISEAGTIMGIRGFGSNGEGPGFGEDILRIRYLGQTGLHLSVVDLPGLIAGASDEQNEEDVDTIKNLVSSYIKNGRTIIIAVVQAGNDIANQSIISKARHFDKGGERTVGVITKPDLINKGTEKRIALLAKNQDTTRLKLGYFIVKNPSPTELAEDISAKQRQLKEQQFFQSSPWAEQQLDSDRIGISSLRPFLQHLLDQHIEKELPAVKSEIRKLVRVTEQELMNLGHERQTTADLRVFLTNTSMEFHRLVVASLNGEYDNADSKFFGLSSKRNKHARLRARVHELNSNFSDHMRTDGQKIKVAEDGDPDESGMETESESGEAAEVLVVSEKRMKEWVKEIYRGTRGKELPGEHNHILLSDLFHYQSSRWYDIAADHLDDICECIGKFLDNALHHTIRDPELVTNLSEKIDVMIRRQEESAQRELEKLWEDEKQHPNTYNHYFTDTIQRSRQQQSRVLIQHALTDVSNEDFSGKLHVSNTLVDGEKLLSSLQRRVTVNMDERACMEAYASLEAYYKVARKTWVDNVCKQVIERHLLRDLPDVFSPQSVAKMADEELEKIAAEAPKDVQRRKYLRDQLKSLQESLKDLQT